MSRRALSALLFVSVLFLAGCGSDAPPQVTFAAGGQERTTGPAQYCDLQLTDCSDDAGAQVRLPVPAGTPVQVTVPDAVAEAPWHVVFSYLDANEQEVNGRSPVFAPTQQQDYSLQLPDATDRLLTAQVQEFGPAPVANPETGEVDFPVRGSWVLVADRV
ncbi:DUF2771 family protein [Pseudonocardia sp. H11422]|uniref:DUF2771 family protein n=1 Tax=Pseudonocardia sp. H11422 TaxID=2835866 RepID=UPI001BDD45C2|nr:DUF2771 family protein [Pseudonocardia sp. H11422]